MYTIGVNNATASSLISIRECLVWRYLYDAQPFRDHYQNV